jgi:hypothetical protein
VSNCFTGKVCLSGRLAAALVENAVANVLPSLAIAELLLTFAVCFRRFDFELYETTERDAIMAFDYFISFAPMDSKGIRMRVVRELEN